MALTKLQAVEAFAARGIRIGQHTDSEAAHAHAVKVARVAELSTTERVRSVPDIEVVRARALLRGLVGVLAAAQGCSTSQVDREELDRELKTLRAVYMHQPTSDVVGVVADAVRRLSPILARAKAQGLRTAAATESDSLIAVN